MKLHFKNLHAAIRWRRKHLGRKIRGVTVHANRPHKTGQHKAPTPAEHAVAFAHLSLHFAGRMTYSMKGDREILFHRKAGDFLYAHADCSQWYAAIVHWCGNRRVSDTDYTGTLLEKGKEIGSPKPGCCVIFGGGTGEHAAMITEKDSHGVWWTIGFGHQGGPDHVSLPNMKAYFAEAGHPGVRFLEFV